MFPLLLKIPCSTSVTLHIFDFLSLYTVARKLTGIAVGLTLFMNKASLNVQHAYIIMRTKENEQCHPMRMK